MVCFLVLGWSATQGTRSATRCIYGKREVPKSCRNRVYYKIGKRTKRNGRVFRVAQSVLTLERPSSSVNLPFTVRADRIWSEQTLIVDTHIYFGCHTTIKNDFLVKFYTLIYTLLHKNRKEAVDHFLQLVVRESPRFVPGIHRINVRKCEWVKCINVTLTVAPRYPIFNILQECKFM